MTQYLTISPCPCDHTAEETYVRLVIVRIKVHAVPAGWHMQSRLEPRFTIRCGESGPIVVIARLANSVPQARPLNCAFSQFPYMLRSGEYLAEGCIYD